MSKYSLHTPIAKRWLIFNTVGALGIAVQFATLATLVSLLGLHYLASTLIAVEAAILHNFFWHERWTWADRAGRSSGSAFARLIRFHLANGIISLIGNIFLMTLFVEHLSLNYLPANALAIAVCSTLNFFAGDRIVYATKQSCANKGGFHMDLKHTRKASRAWLLVIPFVFFSSRPIQSAELKPETVKAWNAYVQHTENRIARELKSDNHFLIMDYQDKDDVLHEHKKLRAGEIVVQSMESEDGDFSVDIPKGRIHHWRGSVFIPGADIDYVLSRVKNPGSADMKQEDVLESRIIQRSPNGFKLFLKLQRSKIVTVVYNTEHTVHFDRQGPVKAHSSSKATKIAEVERIEGNAEREKPEGKDHGFLWRMNSYWRYRQSGDGVIVECESLTLSRGIPRGLGFIIRPLINKVARESMRRTLFSMRDRMTSEIRQTAALGSVDQEVAHQD